MNERKFKRNSLKASYKKYVENFKKTAQKSGENGRMVVDGQYIRRLTFNEYIKKHDQMLKVMNDKKLLELAKTREQQASEFSDPSSKEWE